MWGVSTLRNTSMATLARDLIGVQTEFAKLGQTTNDDAYTLFIDACRRCSSGGGWGDREWEQIWASALRSNPTASISKAAPDAVENCIRAWYWNNHLKCSLEPSKLEQNIDNPSVSVSSNLETEIDELLTQELKESQLQIKILGLAQKYRVSSKELFKVYELREAEKEQETSEETAIEVAKLLASKSASLNISEILPETLAAPIEKLATTLNLKPEAYLLAFEEDLLEYWSGGGAVVLRVGGLATNVRHVGLSIFGNIQPKVLAGFIGDGDDNNGKFARFDFVQQPLSATELFEDAPSIDLSPMLTAIYERLDALPPQKFELDRAARKLFIRFYNHCERQRISHPKQGMRAMWGKAPLKVGKIATILHCLHAAHLGVEISPNITIESVRSAIKFVKFTTDQALSLNLEICESTELAPNLAKIVFLADRKQEPIGISEIRSCFNSKYRPTTGSSANGSGNWSLWVTDLWTLSEERFLSNVDTNEELAELVSFVRVAIAENDPALAKNIQTVLTEVCGSGAVDRQQVWAALTNEEQQALTLLLSQPEPKPQQLELFPQKKESDRDARFSTEAEDWS